ncbi:hypothetical protein MMC24_000025 [Lignoscripta atroalba]|nr:hypothetical protein [Lignoscripta atroalba]
MDEQASSLGEPLLVASTGDPYHSVVIHTNSSESFNSATRHGVQTKDRSISSTTQQESNYFKNAQWSADGTTILTNSADNTLKTFILPPDLLSSSTAHQLTPYITHTLPEPTYATAIHPAYNLSLPSTTLYLLSPRSLPIRLLSPFTQGILASYPLINATTEAYIAPHSLLFDTYLNTNHFFAGSESCISLFDINRNGEGPTTTMPTIPSRRKKLVGGGVGMKGLVSCLGMSSEGVLAAGTFTRWVGLYDSGGSGGTVGVFEIKSGDGDMDEVGDGTGITQVLWSECGRYLCVVERGSNGVGVWDIRGTGRRLSWLNGRKARTGQRLGAEVVGTNVWAGGLDGNVRVWEGLGRREGVVAPNQDFKVHDDAVSSAVMHPSAAVLATCSGQRHPLDSIDPSPASTYEGDSDEEMSSSCDSLDSSSTQPPCYDNSLKIWALS